MTLTRDAITRSVCEHVDLSKAESGKAVEATFEIIKKTLEGGENILITGFGKFCVKDKSKRRGKNPQTKEDLLLAERRVVCFKCATVLRRKLNGRER
jgi:integration host factor subunit alpha